MPSTPGVHPHRWRRALAARAAPASAVARHLARIILPPRFCTSNGSHRAARSRCRTLPVACAWLRSIYLMRTMLQRLACVVLVSVLCLKFSLNVATPFLWTGGRILRALLLRVTAAYVDLLCCGLHIPYDLDMFDGLSMAASACAGGCSLGLS